ncbi:hypothetical protein C5470_19630 [Photorhabdus stackebrandtii]|uniref:Uncharacterized protein n=1 Tax=Photorhabdus stackebrandtii TaxID=1123042 RepID=A0A7X5QQ03_9GAMM|nr:hypothetical protein [Photorhabdus stackebrandtii]
MPDFQLKKLVFHNVSLMYHSTISKKLKRNQEINEYCPKQAHLQGASRRHFAKKATKITQEIKKWVKRLIWQDLRLLTI